MPPRLMFVVNDAWFFVSHRLPIARAAIARGYEVHVVGHRDAKVAELEAAGCRFHEWSLSPRGTSLAGELTTLRSLRRILRSVRPDLLHLVTIKPILYGGLLGRLGGVPGVVYSVSGLGAVFVTEGWRATLFRSLIRRVYRFAVHHPNGVVIFQNEDDRATLLAFLDSKDRLDTEVVPGSGVDVSLYRACPEPPGVPLVVMAARLLRDKGVWEFVEAAGRLRRAGVDARFLIAGDHVATGNPAALTAEERERLRDSAAVVEQPGYCDDIPALFARSAIVVLPSYREGLPKVLIEAGACARAVITTDVPGCRDAIESGVSGLLVPVRDGEALADAIATLLADPARRAKMGLAGRELAERVFDVRHVVERHLVVYGRLARAFTG